MTAAFGEIALLLLACALAGAVFVRLKQPALVAYIMVGIVAGPSALHLVSAHDPIDLLAQVGVAVLLFLAAPKTAMTFYIFAIGLGFTWLATVPPTAGVVGKLFGTRYLATLFGLTLLSHQTGGFFGAWLGGLAIDQQGSYLWMWYADAALAAAAAVCNLPIREAKVVRAAAA